MAGRDGRVTMTGSRFVQSGRSTASQLLTILLFTVLVHVCLVEIGHAQERTGRLEVRLIREDGSGVVGATISLNETGATGVTGTNGQFAFSNLPAGTSLRHAYIGRAFSHDRGRPGRRRHDEDRRKDGRLGAGIHLLDHGSGGLAADRAAPRGAAARRQSLKRTSSGRRRTPRCPSSSSSHQVRS